MRISSTQVVMDDGPVPEQAYRLFADPVERWESPPPMSRPVSACHRSVTEGRFGATDRSFQWYDGPDISKRGRLPRNEADIRPDLD
jgi:hypothetical protein